MRITRLPKPNQYAKKKLNGARSVVRMKNVVTCVCGTGKRLRKIKEVNNEVKKPKIQIDDNVSLAIEHEW
jgi:hypothetical protein